MEKKSFVWRGVKLMQTPLGHVEGDNPAAQVRIMHERNGRWSGLVTLKGFQWTGDGNSPEEVLGQVDRKIAAVAEFINSDGAITPA